LGRDQSAVPLAVQQRLEEELEHDPGRRRRLEAFCKRLRQGRRRNIK